MKCSDIEKQLRLFVPQELSLEGKKENTGLIVGRSDKNVSTIVIAYRVDQETVDYAVSAQADMLISYEPVIKEPVLKIGSTSYQGRLLLQLMRYDIACYAVGSSFDLCKGGTADWIASKLDLSGVFVTEPLQSYTDANGVVCQGGCGRIGHYKKKKTLGEIVERICDGFSQEAVRAYISKDDNEQAFSDVSVIPWADEKSLDAAMERGAQIVVTCGVSCQDAMKVCSEHKAVLELSGQTAEDAFCDCTEQYLSEMLSSSVEILTMPTSRRSVILMPGKE